MATPSGRMMHCLAKNPCLLVFVLLCAPCASVALADEKRDSDSPFKIDDFAPKKGRATFSAGVGYTASDSNRLNVSAIAVPISHAYSIFIPDVSLANTRSDSLFTRLGLRLSATDRLNISAGLKLDAERRQSLDRQTSGSEYSAGWRNLTIGADYRITSVFSQPFVLGFAEIAVADNSSNDITYGSAATIGIGSHWAFDPVIASITATYSYLGTRSDSGTRYNPGDVLAAAASFGVAMNPEITLRAGMIQSFRVGETNRIGRQSGTTSAAFTLGYTQRLSASLVMNIDAQAGVAGSDRAQLWTNFTWRL
ncbi:hypothetical protein [Cupriavidus sp. 2SB]|uniref:hypothetical protein n=1 Tax=Cupriavidus sp. 2SB TaxID=2502199 RepID=UPI0010F83A51|nr:hypothetical protein [Cupriavidus sp. 2SB]